MRHQWQDVPLKVTELGLYGKRQCLNCGVVQVKESIHLWMRVVGYRWYPLVGRCKPEERPTIPLTFRSEVS